MVMIGVSRDWRRRNWGKLMSIVNSGCLVVLIIEEIDVQMDCRCYVSDSLDFNFNLLTADFII